MGKKTFGVVFTAILAPVIVAVAVWYIQNRVLNAHSCATPPATLVGN